LRNDLKVEVDERDYAKNPLDAGELRDLFKGRDPRDFLNPKSPTFKAMGLHGKTLTAEHAIKLMAQEPNLIKRPLIIAGREIIAGFDRDRIKKALS
jgi:arsenate reductase-like glutaredoxin family protein